MVFGIKGPFTPSIYRTPASTALIDTTPPTYQFEKSIMGSIVSPSDSIHNATTTVDRGDDDAEPNTNSCADRTRTSDTIIAVDTRNRSRTVYQKYEKNHLDRRDDAAITNVK